MTTKASFPTPEHQQAALLATEFFNKFEETDTVLVVNSCARGKATPVSDLDMAILVKQGTEAAAMSEMEQAWMSHIEKHPVVLQYRSLHRFTHLHVDVINGIYTPESLEEGGAPGYFEIEIGNQVCYSAHINEPGNYFTALQQQWLPFYEEELRKDRLAMVRDSCLYDLDHIPFYLDRELYFQAFDRLYIAFQKLLQAIFIAKKTYPIAYNKWIREQIVTWLNLPDLYTTILSVLTLSKLDSNDILQKVEMVRLLLDQYTSE